MRRLLAPAVLALCVGLTWTARSEGQTTTPPTDPGHTPLYAGTGLADARWEFAFDTRFGLPEGNLRVGENGGHATHLRLREDLGVTVSEALEASAAFRFTRRDAVRLTALYYFLEGNSRFLGQPVSYNGDTFGPGHVRVNADFYRLGLAYERLMASGLGMFVTSTAGLTYVHLDPELHVGGHRNSEDFYRQELPVPILGLRIDVPMDQRFGARAYVSGGGLPRSDSLRKEGGTIYLSQMHADLGIALTYAITRAVLLEAGYNFTYFFQHEKSREDDNTFELNDNGVRLRLSVAF